MTNPTPLLDRLLSRRVLILDGAMGTMIQRHKLQEADFRGERFKAHPHDLKGNSDVLVLTRPDVIAGIHREYLDAGADIIETNSFNAQAISQADYGAEALAREINEAAARIARKEADAFTARDPSRPRWVAGSIGPTNRTASLSSKVDDPVSRGTTVAAALIWSFPKPPLIRTRPAACWPETAKAAVMRSSPMPPS